MGWTGGRFFAAKGEFEVTCTTAACRRANSATLHFAAIWSQWNLDLPDAVFWGPSHGDKDVVHVLRAGLAAAPTLPLAGFPKQHEKT